MRAVILGAGGHAANIVDALQGSGVEIVGATDRSLPVGHLLCGGVRVIGSDGLLPALRADGIEAAYIGVGGATDNRPRRRLFEHALALGFSVPALVHPSAVVGIDSVVEAGAQVLAQAGIGPCCRIGRNALINQGAVVCHHTTVGDHAHIGPGAMLAGTVTIGAEATVGMGAAILLGRSVGAGCLVHMTATVTRDLPPGQELDRRGQTGPRRP